MARVLVTGGDGFVGAHVVSVLTGEGHDVVWTSLSPPVDSPAIAVDLRTPDALTDHLHDVDAVVHLAARAGGVGFQRTPDHSVFSDNREMTDQVLAAVGRADVGVVFLASSSVVYRPRTDRPFRETDDVLTEADGPSPYAWSKIVDEAEAARFASVHHDTRVVVGRFANVYGPGGPDSDDAGTVIHTLIRRARETSESGLQALEVWGDPEAIRSFIFVTDVARAVALLVSTPGASGVYNVDTGVGISIGAAAQVVVAAVDPGLKIEADVSRPADVPFRVTDPARISALGFAPETSFVDGVRRCVEAAASPD